jgi:hypothetical protein
MKKCNILLAVQEKTPLSYGQVKDIYNITKSYDAILELNDIALKYNKDIYEVAVFFYGQNGPTTAKAQNR